MQTLLMKTSPTFCHQSDKITVNYNQTISFTCILQISHSKYFNYLAIQTFQFTKFNPNQIITQALILKLLNMGKSFPHDSWHMTPLTNCIINKSTACRCQCLALGCLIEDKNSKSKKEHNSEKKKKMHFELPPLIVWIAVWIVNTYSHFLKNIFSNN